MNLGKNLSSFFHEDLYLSLKMQNGKYFAFVGTWRIHNLIMEEISNRVFMSAFEISNLIFNRRTL